jgi:hypothetical protein
MHSGILPLFGGDLRSGFLEPAGRTSAPTAPPSCQAFQSENGFFDLFALETELGKHFVNVQG